MQPASSDHCGNGFQVDTRKGFLSRVQTPAFLSQKERTNDWKKKKRSASGFLFTKKCSGHCWQCNLWCWTPGAQCQGTTGTQRRRLTWAQRKRLHTSCFYCNEQVLRSPFTARFAVPFTQCFSTYASAPYWKKKENHVWQNCWCTVSDWFCSNRKGSVTVVFECPLQQLHNWICLRMAMSNDFSECA